MDIRAFRGWRYVGEPAGDVSSLIAPPYDILSAADKCDLLAGCDRNIVAVDLPHVPPSEVGPLEQYSAAASRLGRWKSSGVLRQESARALYAYEQTYTWAGRTHTRRAIIGGVRATPLGEDVIPHEHTFAGPKADRLRLSERTRTQLSPIFGFYDDGGKRASELLFAAATGEPACAGRLAGVSEKLWAITDADTIGQVARALRDAPVFIADGHHRYTTAMNYRDALKEAGSIDDDHEANFVMFALVERDDPGLLVLPTHRIVSHLSDEFRLEALIAAAGEFDWRCCDLSQADLADADALLGRFGSGAMGLLTGDATQMHVARLKDPDAMRRVAADQSDAWRSLDVAVLHELILDRHLQPWRTDRTNIEYTPDGQAVLAVCRARRAQLGICLQGTPLAAVEAVARAGESMPHKSTYFYPKLATGMVLKPLD